MLVFETFRIDFSPKMKCEQNNKLNEENTHKHTRLVVVTLNKKVKILSMQND